MGTLFVYQLNALYANSMHFKDNLFLQVISWGLSKPDGFTYTEVKQEFNLSETKKEIIESHLRQAYRNHESLIYNPNTTSTADTIFLHIGHLGGYNEALSRYIINYGAQFNYIDYQELQFARKSAGDAKKYSTIAIWISAAALIASVIVPYLIAEFITQDVRVIKQVGGDGFYKVSTGEVNR